MKASILALASIAIAAAAVASTVLQPSGNVVARVIYSEASPVCTAHERAMVASVIRNRVGHKGFGNPPSMRDAVLARRQFSCVGDASNSNWEASGDPEALAGSKAWRQAVELSSGNFRPVTNAVYYHDRRISKPSGWDNKAWRTVKVAETGHFVFYTAVERRQARN